MFCFRRSRKKCRREKVQRKASSRDSGWQQCLYSRPILIVSATRESVDNSNIMSKMQMQQKHFGRDYDERMFKEAATRKIRTFKYDPTKPVEIKYKDGKRAK